MSTEKDSEQKEAPATEKKQVPAKPEEQLPKFEKDLADKVVAKFGEKTEVEFVKPDRIRINVKKDNIKEVAEFIRDDLGFDHAESVSGVDYPEDKEIEVVYHLGSYTDPQLSKQILTLATRAPREDDPKPGNDSTRLPTLREIFYSVEFHERECFEMLGVYFDGHPDNRRLLLPEDWADLPPLRKDFSIKGR
ncbi:MAG: NADH-ubiquinone oxidoreductase subunit C, NADH-quinone oxidoreductase subunit C [Nitrosopumilales archaeon]|nr:MAG: NADH-ubiquinone oxidoreductase subunit C, NADH-quinone oxidoreductase subunit C [Nitrosopumilales archaeon]